MENWNLLLDNGLHLISTAAALVSQLSPESTVERVVVNLDAFGNGQDGEYMVSSPDVTNGLTN
jgi:hypothetical protein